MQEPQTAGAMLRRAREAQGYTLGDVFLETQIDGSLISRWETGKVADMQVYQLFKLVDFLGLDLREVARLLERDDARKRAREGAARKGNEVQIHELANLADILDLDLVAMASAITRDEDAKRAKEKRRAKSGAARASSPAVASTEDAGVAFEADARRKADRQASGTPQAQKRRPAS